MSHCREKWFKFFEFQSKFEKQAYEYRRISYENLIQTPGKLVLFQLEISSAILGKFFGEFFQEYERNMLCYLHSSRYLCRYMLVSKLQFLRI